MARRKSNAEVGVFGVWAYDTRDLLGLSVEQVTGEPKRGEPGLLPTTYSPATLRKIEGGSTKRPGRRMWRELRDLYVRLAEERHVDIESQPQLDLEQGAPGSDSAVIVAAIDRLTAAVETQTAAQMDSAKGLGDVLAEVLARLAGVRERTPGEQPELV